METKQDNGPKYVIVIEDKIPNVESNNSMREDADDVAFSKSREEDVDSNDETYDDSNYHAYLDSNEDIYVDYGDQII